MLFKKTMLLSTSHHFSMGLKGNDEFPLCVDKVYNECN